jgi:8-oxo-dGTP diphosphatase
MIYYTNGFLFSADLMQVALIEKLKPAWQAGLLNAIGGHVEEDESPLRCQIREFKEEAGVEIRAWTHFCALINPGKWQVDFFHARGDYELTSMTKEQVSWIPVSSLPFAPVIPNLRWLIPMALQNDVQLASVYIKAESHQGRNHGG